MKFKHRVSTVTFVGHRITADGLQVDPAKVSADVNMPTPDSVAAIRRLMGMANYVSRFLPGLSDMMESLRKLTCHNTEWWWGPEHDQAVEKVKQAITAAPVFSRTLTSTEQQHAQIEKELLASLFGPEKFDQYVYGRCVIVQTDHKPLESTMKRSLLDVPRRLQRLLR